MADIELQPDLEFAVYVDELSSTLQSSFIPRDALRRGVRNAVFVLCVVAIAQDQAPQILSELPPGAEQVLEEQWPDWAHLPGWLVRAIILGTAISGLSYFAPWGSESRSRE